MPTQATLPASLTIALWPVDRVRPYDSNPRTITQAAIDKVAASLTAFGWRQPLVVDADGVLIVGHTRLAAARKLGLTEVPVHVADTLTADQVRAYRLADNRSHDEATWDEDALAAELAKVKEADLIAVTGFDTAELDRYLAELAGTPAPGDVGATENGFEYQEKYGVIVECRDESHQKRIFDDLSAAGEKCRVVAV
jgi:ParB-like chromosome segregation protein Spo0J